MSSAKKLQGNTAAILVTVFLNSLVPVLAFESNETWMFTSNSKECYNCSLIKGIFLISHLYKKKQKRNQSIICMWKYLLRKYIQFKVELWKLATIRAWLFVVCWQAFYYLFKIFIEPLLANSGQFPIKD